MAYPAVQGVEIPGQPVDELGDLPHQRRHEGHQATTEEHHDAEHDDSHREATRHLPALQPDDRRVQPHRQEQCDEDQDEYVERAAHGLHAEERGQRPQPAQEPDQVRRPCQRPTERAEPGGLRIRRVEIAERLSIAGLHGGDVPVPDGGDLLSNLVRTLCTLCEPDG